MPPLNNSLILAESTDTFNFNFFRAFTDFSKCLNSVSGKQPRSIMLAPSFLYFKAFLIILSTVILGASTISAKILILYLVNFFFFSDLPKNSGISRNSSGPLSKGIP